MNLRPEKLILANTQAKGVPSIKTIKVAVKLTISETRKASAGEELVSKPPSELHGARWKRPINGRVKKTVAIAARITKNRFMEIKTRIVSEFRCFPRLQGGELSLNLEM